MILFDKTDSQGAVAVEVLDTADAAAIDADARPLCDQCLAEADQARIALMTCPGLSTSSTSIRRTSGPRSTSSASSANPAPAAVRRAQHER